MNDGEKFIHKYYALFLPSENNEYVSSRSGYDSEKQRVRRNMDDSTESEEIVSHQNSTGVIDHTCDENGINLISTEEEADVTSIKSINGINDISMNDGENSIHKYYALFLPSKNNKDVSSG